MADERNYYVLCDANCKYPAMTKEQILTAIEQAISKGEIKDVDAGFVTTLKETNGNCGLKFWVGKQAEYNAQKDTIPPNTLAIITDDTTAEDINAAIKELKADIQTFQAELLKEFNGTVLYEAIENWDGNTTIIEPEAGTVDYTEFSRFVAYFKYNGDTGIATENEIKVTFDWIEIEKSTSGASNGAYTITAYASRCIAGKETNDITTYKLIIDYNPITPSVALNVASVFVSASDGFGEENVFPYKVIGYKN